jgi:hypothetical protein
MKYLLHCPMNTKGWTHSTVACCRNTNLSTWLRSYVTSPLCSLDSQSKLPTFRSITTRRGGETIITEIFCWQEHMISSVWISTLLIWEKMEWKGESRRRAETLVRYYHRIRVGPSLLLLGSEYVHLRTVVCIPTFTCLFLLPKSHFLLLTL